VHGIMDLHVIEQRREEMLREAELNRLKKALRATRKRPTPSRLASTVAWELTWAASSASSYGRRKTTTRTRKRRHGRIERLRSDESHKPGSDPPHISS
jgi:hypothetical protein